MNHYLYSAVQTEVISLAEAKMAIKIDSDNFADNITVTATVTGGYKTAVATAPGTGINVYGKKTLAALAPVNLKAAATLDVKIQESLDNVTYSDWSGGAFTQVTTANDTVIQEKEYTGDSPYIRVAYTIVANEADFATHVITSEPESVEDDYITDLISAAREYAESVLNRAVGSQVWKLVLDDFPDGDYIELPYPPLLSVTSVTYINSTGVSATMSASESSGYIVDTQSEPGQLFLAYANSWPTFTAYPYNGVEILYTCGYTAATVPKRIKDAILKLIGLLHNHRVTGIPQPDLQAVDNLLQGVRIINHG